MTKNSPDCGRLGETDCRCREAITWPLVLGFWQDVKFHQVSPLMSLLIRRGVDTKTIWSFGLLQQIRDFIISMLLHTAETSE